jgi:opacity protein-like surface antigen
MTSKFRLFTFLATLLSLTAPALAADSDLVIAASQQDEYVPVEIGSGWYIRGDIGVNLGGRHNSDQYDIGAVNYTNSYRDALNVGVGVGYRFNDMFRADAGIDHFFDSSFNSTLLVAPIGPCLGTGEYIDIPTGTTYFDDYAISNCLRTDKASYTASTFMANLYADLGTISGFTPFVGAGLGLARVSWAQETNSITCVPVDPTIHREGCAADGTIAQPPLNTVYTDPGVVNNGTDWRVAYSLTAGVAYQLSKNLLLDTSYRFTSIGGGTGSIPYGPTPGSSIAQDGFGLHQVKMGLRYEIW